MSRTPFKMKGYSYPGTAPVKHRRTKSTAMTHEDASAHNATPATESHYGHPHGARPELETQESDATTEDATTEKESPAKGGWWAHQTKGHGGPSRSGASPMKQETQQQGTMQQRQHGVMLT